MICSARLNALLSALSVEKLWDMIFVVDTVDSA